MKILLIDIDSKIPNLALHKIATYYKDKGDEVIWNLPIMRDCVDKIYVSCVFDWNKKLCEEWEGRAEIGGSGYSLTKKLPSGIEAVKPRINLGFTTRGCIRKCSFCVVPKKEGFIEIIGDIYDIWDKRSKEIELLDNNIMALFEHFKKTWGQIKKEGLKLKENGLDIRLLDKERAEILASIKHYEYHFAFDSMQDKSKVEKGIEILQEVNIRRSCFYVLVGFDTTIADDLERLNFLRDKKQNAYVQRYYYKKGDKKYIALARWVNQHHIFQAMTFNQFLDLPENRNYKNAF